MLTLRKSNAFPRKLSVEHNIASLLDISLYAYMGGAGHNVINNVFAMLLSFQQEISDVGQYAISRWKIHLLCRLACEGQEKQSSFFGPRLEVLC